MDASVHTMIAQQHDIVKPSPKRVTDAAQASDSGSNAGAAQLAEQLICDRTQDRRSQLSYRVIVTVLKRSQTIAGADVIWSLKNL